MKNQVKKSLSLIMAVLMLMSCWVWVAPAEAEAAGGTTTYHVKYVVNVTDDWNNGASNSKIRIYYKPLNGTGTETYKEFTQTEGSWQNNGEKIPVNTTIPGFPTRVTHYASTSLGRTVAYNSATLYVGTSEENCTTICFSGGSFQCGDALTAVEKTVEIGSTMSSVYPKLSSVDNPAAVELTLGRLGTATNATVSPKIETGKDQYGVSWEATFPTSGWSHKVAINGTGTTTGLSTNNIYVSANTGSNNPTVTAKPATQLLQEDKAKVTYYLISTYGSATATTQIAVNHPAYQATFHANGGSIGADSSSVSATGQVKVPESLDDAKTYYGSKIGKQPAYTFRQGFEFMGFYSTQMADATGKTFTPSGTKFEDNVTKVPSTGDTNWYAAWQSSPITATFVTQDGQLIGTVEGRYNNSLLADNMYKDIDNLNANVRSSHSAGKVKFNNTDNTPVYTDGSSTFTFNGWKIIEAYDESLIDKVVDSDSDVTLKGDVTFQATYTKATAQTYTVAFEDGNGNTVSTKSGYKYRDSVTNVPATDPTKATDDRYNYEFIGWAKDIGKNFYTVDENDCDENGAAIAYTHKDGAVFIVKGDASYVPVFRMVPREYKITYNYTGDNETPMTAVIEGYHWHDGAKMPEIKDNYTYGGYRYYLIGWKVGNDVTVKQLDEIIVEGDMTLTAVYGNPEAAKYTINFYGKDADGVTDVLLNEGANIYEHNDPVTAPSVPQTIDTDEALYTFAGWSPAINTTASGDADYYATYTKKTYADLHFYNYDGTLIYELDGKENGLFVDEEIPAYSNIVDGENVLPAKAEDVVGTYNFTGWANGNGNEVVPGTDSFTGDTYLYAQFETVYKEYTVKFVNEGTPISTVKYHYGDPIVVPSNPTKEADVEYIYDFRAWSPDVSDVCYGDATYEATYRRTPQYYAVTWLKDNKEVHTESNYQYNAKIQQATIDTPVSYAPPATGKTWALKHWVQCDANGNDVLVDGEQVLFTRGQRMPAEHLYFYPVFEEVDNVLTVTFYKEDGVSLLGEAKIPYGRDIGDYDDEFAAKAPKASDDTHHYIIENWVNINGGATVTTITADISVKATYTAEAHNKQIYEIVAEPTCNVPGYAHYKCDVPECTDIDYNVVIAPIADEGAPTGQIYVGTDKWTLEDYTAGIDYEDVKYVGPNTQLIVNAEDTGTRSMPWNLEGVLSRGVGKIEYYVAGGKIDPTTISNWTEIYNYEALRQEALNTVLAENNITLVDYDSFVRGTAEQKMQKAEIDRAVDALLSIYNANATGVASNLNLVNGNSYVIYIRVSDREGNGEVNTCYFSSGTISYGSAAAEIAVSGEGYGTKFCDKATVTVTDDSDGLKVYLDGEEVSAYTNPGTTSANGTFVAAFETEEAGVHNVTVVDKHGNKTMKTFEIKGNHTYRHYITAATCDNAGSRYDLCTLCGVKANETAIPALGHSYTANYVDKAADCINDGYRTYVCDNNCGTKLVLKPTDAADKIATAKKYVEAAEGATEGTWVALTAADLAHLKATGVHTYAKVIGEDGEATSEDAWIIDKEATCTAPGSKHKDCTKCGETVTEPIPVDTENGHKFYREKVTLEPTCTTDGAKTKTCRYCGYVETVEVLKALGHTAGEYRVITAATCEAVGSKILTCAVCGVDIGEPIKDDKGTVTGFDGEAVEIPATDHAWKISGEVYEEDGKYYQNYVCKNDSTHTKREEVEDYQPPVAVTVTFDFAGGYYTVPAVGNPNELGYVPEMLKGTQAISTFVGESIGADEVETAFKLNNATKTYTFSHWVDADGKEVKFPIEVKGDATYTAVYTEKYVNYTITYYKDDGTTEFKKTGYLHNGDKVTLADGPAKAETNLVTYKFVGWIVIGSNPEVVYTNEVTINGASINLKAKYESVKKQYAVTYAYSKNDILETFAVDAGAEARDCAIVPVKANDTKYHYEFKAWNKAEQLKSVESNIYTTPDFEAESHEYEVTVKTPAACGVNRVDTYTCEVCGYTYDKEAANTALEHIWGESVYDEETGKNTVTCTREGCGVTEDDTRTFTAKFFVSAADTDAIKTISYIPWGSKIDATRLPATPTKESTATTDYTFKGWAVKGTTDVVDFAELAIKQNYDFVALFTESTREYNVIFAYDASNVIKTFTKVKAGSSVTFDGAEPKKAFDATYHYTFSNWKGYDAGIEAAQKITVTNIQSDLYITAEFSKEKHAYTESTLGEATCTNGAGTRYTCTCGKFYDVAGKPLDHAYVEIDRKEATANNDGFIKYQCENCGATKEEVLKYNDNTIEVKVYAEHNGSPVSGIKVEVRSLTTGAAVYGTTNASGIAVFRVDRDDVYQCYVNETPITLTTVAGGNLEGVYSYTDQADCTCACHRSGVWGAIFRFFHKIIKLFTGEFKCCTNPDPMYG